MTLDLSPQLRDALENDLVIGVDEVGRGCLAGPVAACAYVFLRPRAEVPGLRDSKKLSPLQRQRLEPVLHASGLHGYGEASSAEIDKIGINAANFLAMRRALQALKLDSLAPYHIVVDGNQRPALDDLGAAGLWCVVKADDKVPAVSAAAVLAKLQRDRFMHAAALDYPGYGFEKHAGYGVETHRRAIDELGPCALHRMSFEPLRSGAKRRPI